MILEGILIFLGIFVYLWFISFTHKNIFFHEKDGIQYIANFLWPIVFLGIFVVFIVESTVKFFDLITPMIVKKGQDDE